jgi:toxin ParE1/3/4
MSAGQARSDLMAGGRYEVLLTSVAMQNVTSICNHMAEFDSPASADHVLGRLMKAVDEPASLPERGGHPKNLLALGIKDYRQSVFKPHRVICRVDGELASFYLISNGR